MCEEQSHIGNVAGIISKIERQKRNAQRYNIYIQDEYAFSVHEDILISHRLLKGKEITAEEFHLIIAEEETKKAERAAYHYLSYRPRTRKEMNEYLKGKGLALPTIEHTINKLLSEGYLDDRYFAQKWVSERLRLKKKGPLLLKEELKQKGISSALVEEALHSIEHEDQIEACLPLAEKKWNQLQNKCIDRREQKHKLIGYLQRRGFSFDVIQSVVHRLEES